MADDYASDLTTLGHVAVGSPATGDIETAYDHDWFSVSLQLGRSYRIDLEGSATFRGTLSDPFLYGLYDSTGLLIDNTLDDDSGSGTNSQLEFTAPASGTYYIAAGAFSGYTGTYQLSVADLGAGDDYGDTPAGAGTVAVGASVNGELEAPYDQDLFSVSLQAGWTYRVDLEGSATAAGTLYDPYLRGIYDSNGNLLDNSLDDDDGTGRNSLLEFTAPSSGTYYIAAGAFSAYTGSYRLSVTNLGSADDYGETTANAGSLGVGSSVTGEIESAGDNDWFAVSLQSGRSYRIDLVGDTLADPYLNGLYDQSGNLVSGTANDDGGEGLDSQVEFTPGSSATYYVSAGAYGNLTGTYELAVTDLGSADDYSEGNANPGSVSVGGSTSGNIEQAYDRDWFAVTLQAGETYQVDLEGAPTSAGTLSDPYLRGIYDAGGNPLNGTANDDGGVGYNSQVEFTPGNSGTFYIAASGFDSNTGSYRLSVSGGGSGSDDHGETTASAGQLPVGGSANGEIETAGDRDWFAVSLQANHEYTIDLEGLSSNAGTLADTYLWGVYDSSGNLLPDTANDDGGSGLNSRLTLLPDSSGSYSISAGAYGSLTGTYKLSVTDNGAISTDDYGDTPTTSGSVTVGGSTQGEIEAANDHDWFAVAMQRNHQYTIDLEGSPTNSGTLSDTLLQGIYDAGGSLVSNTSNDDGGSGKNSRLSFVAGSSATYYLAAAASAGQTGTYKLSVSDQGLVASDDYGDSTATAGLVNVDASSSGSIEQPGDIDWFAVNLQAGKRYQVDLGGSASSSGTLDDPYLRGIYDSSGQLIANTRNDDGGTGRDSQLEFSPASGGTYYIAAGAYSTQTGTYQVSVSDITPASNPGGDYDIQVNFNGDASYNGVFESAARRWEQIIIGDLPDFNLSGYGLVDDLVIDASVTDIDGVGGVLGRAGARYMRPNGGLPISGIMAFDSADMANMQSKGILEDVILHEMGHVLGFSNYFFSRAGLLSGSYDYTGSNALSLYQQLSGDNTLSSVPLETNGGSGTAGSHWSEDVFNTELMTGYAENNPPMPLSSLTVGAFEDLGYTVNYAAADQLSLLMASSAVLAPGLQAMRSAPLEAQASSQASSQADSQAGSQISAMSAQPAPLATGATLSYEENKPLVWDPTASFGKLAGVVVESSESKITFFETQTGNDYLVELQGSFEKGSPSQTDDIKGDVSSILLLGGADGHRVMEVSYTSARNVASVLGDLYQGVADLGASYASSGYLQNDNVSAGGGDDHVSLGDGDDTLDGGAGNDTLLGSAGIDSLYGGDDDDLLDGGLAGDRMEGGLGDDVYQVDHASDQVIEAGGGGDDRVNSSITWALASNVEKLALSGVSAINGTGNAAANRLSGNPAANRLTGLLGKDTLLGNRGNDTLLGGGGNDSLIGGNGKDLLDGGAKADLMRGGLGNDTYRVAQAGDQVREKSNQGTDTVQALVRHTLGANVENLLIKGSKALNGTGNALGNRLLGNRAANQLNGLAGTDTLLGNRGNDTLVGGAGADTLRGGLGKDRFRYQQAAHGKDTINDFRSGVDKVEVLGARFKGLSTGALSAANFVSNLNGKAKDANDYFTFSTRTQSLYFDRNGNKAGGRVMLFSLANSARVKQPDIVVV